MKKVNFLLLVVLIATSCRNTGNKIASDSWSSLTIVSEASTVIAIHNYDDTTKIKYYDSGSFFSGYHKVKIDSLKTYFTMAEKDTIYRLVNEIISNPVKPKVNCTDFAGELKVIIDYNGEFRTPGSYRQSIEYSGICNWDTLSVKTMQLHKILKRKIKWWNK